MKKKSPIPKKRKDVAATRPQNVEWIDIINPHFFLEILYISDICMYYVYWITYILDHGGQIASLCSDQPTSFHYYYFYYFSF